MVKVITVRFKNKILFDEIPLFRGAINSAIEDADTLFHNHVDNSHLRYAYPLIQYKRINQKAAIVCLGEGTEAIDQFFSSCQFDIMLGDREVRLEMEPVKASQPLIQTWDGVFSYRIWKWLPLNKDNYSAFCAMDSLAERCAMLDRILTANILSFAKGIGIHFENHVECHITKLGEPVGILFKGVKLMGFDAEFKTNVSLPDYIGLGKGVSLGMGTIKSIENNTNTQ